MQISESLPQFDEASTLILVASKQAADIYIAHEGTIEKISEIRVEKPTYSDREGHFKRRAGGKTLGSGGVYEEKDKKTKADFYNELEDALNKTLTNHTIEEVIVLSSPQDYPATKEHLPAKIQKAIIAEIDGNYVGDHPDDILSRIQDNLS